MPTDVERLLVKLEVSQAKFERQMAKSVATSNRRARQIETRFNKMNASVVRSLRGVAAPIAAAFTVREAGKLIETSTRITNALKVAGLEGRNLEVVYDQLSSAAKRNAAPLESLVELYSRASLVQKELGISQKELIGFTNNVALALRVSGRTAQQSSGALLQLSQALGSGVVRAEEFNSILEGAPTIARAAANGLKEAGGSVSKLRNLVVDGKVSSEAFFRAFEAGSVTLERKAASVDLTVAQAFTNLETKLIDIAREFDKSSGASKALAKAIEISGDGAIAGAKGLASFQTSAVLLGQNLREKVLPILQRFKEAIVATLSLDTIEQTVNLSSKTSLLRSDNVVPTSKPPVPVRPVSTEDFAVPSSSKSKKPKARQLDEFQREIAAIRERTEALKVEQSVVGASVEVEERARAAHDLLNAARQAGIPITAELSALIDTVSGQYAREVVELENLQKAQEDTNAAIREFGDDAKQAFSGILDDVRAGASALDIMRNAVDNLAASLSNRVLDSLFDGAFGGGAGSPGGSLVSSLFAFADGGVIAGGKPQRLQKFAGGGVSNKAAIFGEAGPEAAVPLPDGRRIPVDLNLSRGTGGGMNVQIINQSKSTVEPAGQGRDAQGNPFQRLVVRDAVRSEVPGAFKQIAPAYNQKPTLARR